MRDIKFRAKRIDSGAWVYGDYFKTPLTDENSGTTPDAGWFFLSGEKRHCIGRDHVAFVVDVSTLGQFTGLKDKNGLEIYQGDVLECGYRMGNGLLLKVRGQVKYADNGACFALEIPDGDGFITWSFSNYTDFNVIGNVHQNRDLLSESREAA